ncbi:MAG: hypothetical protein JW801_14460 [Bacteroidales bacterium]|nr:hypothetical protein [Bacteroidales bacterium]
MELSIIDHKLVIDYRITNSNPENLFKVWIEVYDAKDQTINALSLSGDIGSKIIGGDEYQIVWDYYKDMRDVNQEVFLEVCAELIQDVQKPEPVLLDPKESATLAKKEVNKDNLSDSELNTNSTESNVLEASESAASSALHFTKVKALYRSVLFPGLGFTWMDRSSAHLAKGLTGYGLIVSSVIFNRLSIKTYNQYLAAATTEDRNTYFNASSNQDNLSEIMAWSAIGIWTIELIWIAFEPLKAHRQLSGILIQPGIDPKSGVASLFLSVSF